MFERRGARRLLQEGMTPITIFLSDYIVMRMATIARQEKAPLNEVACRLIDRGINATAWDELARRVGHLENSVYSGQRRGMAVDDALDEWFKAKKASKLPIFYMDSINFGLARGFSAVEVRAAAASHNLVQRRAKDHDGKIHDIWVGTTTEKTGSSTE